jgi:hypothetical protein
MCKYKNKTLMTYSTSQPKRILIIDDNQAFVKSIMAISKVPVKWIFEGYDLKQHCEKLATDIIKEYNDLSTYLVLININIKLDDSFRQENKGINLYRLAIGKLNSGSDESIFLYSFLSKTELGKENILFKILPNSLFKRLPMDLDNLLTIQ